MEKMKVDRIAIFTDRIDLYTDKGLRQYPKLKQISLRVSGEPIETVEDEYVLGKRRTLIVFKDLVGCRIEKGRETYIICDPLEQ